MRVRCLVEDFDVLIVGAGIGGLALGCALGTYGRRTCILEGRTVVQRSKRGLTLQPNGLAALGDLGLLDKVVRIGSKTSRVAWHEIGGKPLATFDYSVLEHPRNYLLTVIPSELELVLRDVFSKMGGIVYESTFFREILPTGSQRIRVGADRNDSPIEFSARIIVGADGADSRVRQALEIPVRVREYPDHFFLHASRTSGLVSSRSEAVCFSGGDGGLFSHA